MVLNVLARLHLLSSTYLCAHVLNKNPEVIGVEPGVGASSLDTNIAARGDRRRCGYLGGGHC